MSEQVIVSAGKMQSVFFSILIKNGFSEDTASLCAETFTSNSLDGVYTHGVNRFPRFIEYLKKGVMDVHAVPSMVSKSGAIEQWNGNSGPGIPNAFNATARAIEISKQNGIGCVGLANTNHWMRGGTYGWKAAKEGFAFIGWTNTIANMPAWNAIDNRLGNNPLVLAVPYGNEALVLDMAMSQYSFGSMELSVMKNELLPVHGGFDSDGGLTRDPAAIIESKKAIASRLLERRRFIITARSAGNNFIRRVINATDHRKGIEYNVSQVFIAIDLSRLHNFASIANGINLIISDYIQSIPESKDKSIRYPGERALQTRNKNLLNGIPVVKKVWDEILSL